jgi:hypothetical protein
VPTRPPLPLKLLLLVVVTTPPQVHVALRRRESLLARTSMFPNHPTSSHIALRTMIRTGLMVDAVNHAPAHLESALAKTAPIRTRTRRRLHARKLQFSVILRMKLMDRCGTECTCPPGQCTCANCPAKDNKGKSACKYVSLCFQLYAIADTAAARTNALVLLEHVPAPTVPTK